MLIFCVFNLILGIFWGILAFSCLFSEAGAGAHIRDDLRSPGRLPRPFKLIAIHRDSL